MNRKSSLRHKFIPEMLTYSAMFTAIGIMQSTAAITFVDALEGSSGNTFATGGSLSNTSWLSTANNSTSNNTQWVRRSTFGIGGAVYQAHVSNITNFPEITTQITGLTNGVTYDIWAFFWDNVGTTAEKWTISAGLTSGSLTSYSNAIDNVVGTTTTGVVNASTLSFSNLVPANLTEDSGGAQRDMFGVKLGQVVVSGGVVNVFVDRNILGAAGQNRVWYDGVGFEAIPEPSSALLCGLGLLAMFRRRR